jgi:hypothetical protein
MLYSVPVRGLKMAGAGPGGLRYRRSEPCYGIANGICTHKTASNWRIREQRRVTPRRPSHSAHILLLLQHPATATPSYDFIASSPTFESQYHGSHSPVQLEQAFRDDYGEFFLIRRRSAVYILYSPRFLKTTKFIIYQSQYYTYPYVLLALYVILTYRLSPLGNVDPNASYSAN